MTTAPTIMRRTVITETLGPPEAYRLVEQDPGSPSTTQVRIAIRATGISFVDVLTAAGGYQVKPPLPYIPGSECAGVIEAVGDEVRSEEHTSELQSLMRSSYAVFCSKKNNTHVVS